MFGLQRRLLLTFLAARGAAGERSRASSWPWSLPVLVGARRRSRSLRGGAVPGVAGRALGSWSLRADGVPARWAGWPQDPAPTLSRGDLPAGARRGRRRGRGDRRAVRDGLGVVAGAALCRGRAS